MKIYIAGKITGLSRQEVNLKFIRAVDDLRVDKPVYAIHLANVRKV